MVVALTSLELLVADEEASARLLRLDGVAHALVHGVAARRRARLVSPRRLPEWPEERGDGRDATVLSELAEVDAVVHDRP